LHQVGDLLELNVKFRCQKVKKKAVFWAGKITLSRAEMCLRGKIWTARGPGLEETGMSVNGFVSQNRVFFIKGYYLRYNLHIIVLTDISFSISKNFVRLISCLYRLLKSL